MHAIAAMAHGSEVAWVRDRVCVCRLYANWLRRHRVHRQHGARSGRARAAKVAYSAPHKGGREPLPLDGDTQRLIRLTMTAPTSTAPSCRTHWVWRTALGRL